LKMNAVKSEISWCSGFATAFEITFRSHLC
jgi:hypothetical protein